MWHERRIDGQANHFYKVIVKPFLTAELTCLIRPFGSFSKVSKAWSIGPSEGSRSIWLPCIFLVETRRIRRHKKTKKYLTSSGAVVVSHLFAECNTSMPNGIIGNWYSAGPIDPKFHPTGLCQYLPQTAMGTIALSSYKASCFETEDTLC